MYYFPRASLRDIYQPARLEFMLAGLEQNNGDGGGQQFRQKHIRQHPAAGEVRLYVIHLVSVIP